MLYRFSALLIAFLCVSSALAQEPVKKKNLRPVEVEVEAPPIEVGPSVYFYEFEKPDADISEVRIEHDKNGNGTITFRKRKLEENFTLPIRLSHYTLSLLTTHWSSLQFLDSATDYQSKRDYPHLGTKRLKMADGGKSRTAEFNWTDEPDAKFLMDEYKKIGYQHIWKFDINVARVNQPLESPKLMRNLEKYLRMNLISDPEDIVPFLLELADDVRISLIARNHAKRLVEEISQE